MAGRPPNPVLVSSAAYVWLHGAVELPQAQEERVPEEGARALVEGRLVFLVEGRQLRVEGVLFGQTLDEEIQVPNLQVPGLGLPVFRMFGVAAEGRVPGVPCELGLFADTAKNRKWMVSFGASPLEFWRQALVVPPFIKVASGAIRFTPRNNSRIVRHELFEERRAADLRWRN